MYNNSSRPTPTINRYQQQQDIGAQFLNGRMNGRTPHHPNLNMRGDGERVIRSEVWNCFDLDGLMAICRACNERLKVGPTRQTSSLWRHLKRHSREVQTQLLMPRAQQPPFKQFDQSMGAAGMSMNSGLNNNQHHQTAYQSVGAILAGHHSQSSGDPRFYANNAFGNTNIAHRGTGGDHQHFYGANGGGGLLLPTTSTATEITSQQTSSLAMDLLNGADGQPMVTVDCKAVESLDLNQLLGIGQSKKPLGTDQSEGAEGGNNSTMEIGNVGQEEQQEDEEEEGEEEEDIRELLLDGPLGQSRSMAVAAKNGVVASAGLDATALHSFQTALVEFLLENALPFRRLLHQSPTLQRLLRLFAPISNNDNTNGGLPPFHQFLPSTELLLTQIVPKMFEQALAERKAQFEEDFFVLVLRRTRIETAGKGTWILRISAVKLGDGFGLCSRCLGVFAFKGGLDRMRDALQRCFEFGQVQLKLWQVSAVVHDGTADFVELCRQLDLPSIPSTHSLLRNVYAELDKLEFSTDCVRRVKARFEKAIGNCIDGSHFSAFSIAVPQLITRVDAFFRQQLDLVKSEHQQQSPSNVAEQDGAPVPVSAERRLLTKFRTLWTFQRERLLADPVARMSIFLNPSACRQQNDGPFTNEQWAKIETNIVEEICQACLPSTNNGSGEMSENEMFERKTDIEAEVNNFVDAAICECRRTTPAATSMMSDSVNGKEDGMAKMQFVEDNTFPPQYSLSELLLWWSVNLERFPRVCHLARQFCAIPISAEIGIDWKGTDGNGQQDMDKRNAQYAAELINKDLLPTNNNDDAENGEEAILNTLSHLLTLRMAVLEKNRFALSE